jgi:ribosomal protein L37AE/L43A
MSDAADAILVCPRCDDPGILPRGSPLADLDRVADGAWYCPACRRGFDAPAERASETHITRSGLPKALLEADPDEVSADG